MDLTITVFLRGKAFIFMRFCPSKALKGKILIQHLNQRLKEFG